jgi:hypothetical protein
VQWFADLPVAMVLLWQLLHKSVVSAWAIGLSGFQLLVVWQASQKLDVTGWFGDLNVAPLTPSWQPAEAQAKLATVA